MTKGLTDRITEAERILDGMLARMDRMGRQVEAIEKKAVGLGAENKNAMDRIDILELLVEGCSKWIRIENAEKAKSEAVKTAPMNPRPGDVLIYDSGDPGTKAELRIVIGEGSGHLTAYNPSRGNSGRAGSALGEAYEDGTYKWVGNIFDSFWSREKVE